SSFFFLLPPPPDTYPLSLHDALPISRSGGRSRRLTRVAPASGGRGRMDRQLRLHRGHLDLWREPGHDGDGPFVRLAADPRAGLGDRKSTRLNSSHVSISYAVFCLKKK